MTTATIKAQYKNGALELRDPVNLHEGDEVIIQFVKAPDTIPTIDNESRAWVDANLFSLPPYDWGKDGIPKGNPVEHDPELGFVVIEE